MSTAIPELIDTAKTVPYWVTRAAGGTLLVWTEKPTLMRSPGGSLQWWAPMSAWWGSYSSSQAPSWIQTLPTDERQCLRYG